MAPGLSLISYLKTNQPTHGTKPIKSNIALAANEPEMSEVTDKAVSEYVTAIISPNFN